MNPFDLRAHLEDEHADDNGGNHLAELDSDDLRRLHDFLHSGRAIAVKPKHTHTGAEL